MVWPLLALGGALALGGSALGHRGPGGRKEKIQRVPMYTPEQEGLINLHAMQQKRLAPSIYDYWSRLLSNDPEIKKEMQAPVLSEFYNEHLPQLAQVYGDPSGDTTALQAVAGRDMRRLQEGLDAQRHQNIQQAINQSRGFADIGLARKFNTLHRPERPNVFSQIGGTMLGMGTNLAMARGLGIGSDVGLRSMFGIEPGHVGGTLSAPGMASLSPENRDLLGFIHALQGGPSPYVRERNLGRASGTALTPAKPSSYHYTRRSFR
ncbi:MAG: hypothetical protein OXF02_07035 [Simkaniaceae bacterium]|nr:hypothetical protein [Simkaniaceae bacterium]